MLQGFKQVRNAGQRHGPGCGGRDRRGFRAGVTSFVNNIITKVIAAVFSKPDFSALKLPLNGTDIGIGSFLNDLINFLLVAAAVHFFMVAPMNAWKARAARNAAPADPTSKECPECLSEIPVAARRCAFCTSVVQSA